MLTTLCQIMLKVTEISSFRHKGLKLLYEDDSVKGVPPAMADKLRKLLLALETADNLHQASVFLGGTSIP